MIPKEPVQSSASSRTDPPPSKEELDRRRELKEIVLKSVIETHYPEAVKSAGTARTRAQAAQTVTSLVAGALLAVLTVPTLSDHIWVTKLTAVGAVGFWFLAGALYVWAVAVPVERAEPGDVEASDDLVKLVFGLVRGELTEVDKRQKWANRAALAALLMTLVTYAFVLFGPSQVSTTPGSLVLSPQGVEALEKLCPDTASPLIGEIHGQSPGDSGLSVTLLDGSCGADGAQVVHIPMEDVEMLVLER